MERLWKDITVSVWCTNLVNEINELYEDDEEGAFTATLAAAATMIDGACEIYGKDKDETRKKLLAVGPEVDEIMEGTQWCT